MLSTVLPLLGLFALVFVVELALFWASTALGSVEVNAVRLLAGAFLAALAWAGAVCGGVALAGGPGQSLLAPDNRAALLLGALVGLVVSWAVPAVGFVPL